MKWLVSTWQGPEALFAPVAEPWRVRAWLTPFALMGGLALLIAGLAAFIMAAVAAAPLAYDFSNQRMMVEIEILYMAIMAVLGFWMVTAWIRHVEGRGRDSIGLPVRFGFLRQISGLLIGAGIAWLIGVAGWALSLWFGEGVDPYPGLQAYWRTWQALAPRDMILLGLLAASLWAYAWFEEIVFRGWLLSAMSLRWGAGIACLASSLLFGLYHMQFYEDGWLIGGFWIGAIMLSGIFFCLVAIWQRSLYLAAGLHAGFNIWIIVGLSLDNIGLSPDQPVGGAIMDALNWSADYGEGDTVFLTWPDLADPIVFAILTLALAWVLRKRLTQAPQQVRKPGPSAPQMETEDAPNEEVRLI